MSNLPKQVEEDTSKIVLMPLYNVKLWSSLDNNSSNSFGGGVRKENNRYTSVTSDEDQDMCDLVGDIVSDDQDTTVKDFLPLKEVFSMADENNKDKKKMVQPSPLKVGKPQA